MIHRPAVQSDSVVGTAYVRLEPTAGLSPSNPSSSTRETAASIALNDVTRIQTRGFSAGNTAVLAGGLGLVTLLLYWVGTSASPLP